MLLHHKNTKHKTFENEAYIMENTLKMFKSINSQNLTEISLEELSRTYRLNHNPQILANAFIRNYDLINRLSAKFFTLDKSDISSISVSALDYCLQNYDLENTKAKFSSYFYSVLYNKFNTEQKSNLYNKRKVNYIVENISIQGWNEFAQSYFQSDENNGYSEIDQMIKAYNAPLSEEFEDNLVFKIVINNDTVLTELEKRCCNLMLSTECQYNKSEMAELLGVCRPKYNKILKSLQSKLKVILQM